MTSEGTEAQSAQKATEQETQTSFEAVTEAVTEETTPTALPKTPYAAVPVTLDTLLESGAHFGHQTRRWNPKMLPFIYGERNEVHIINLDLTLDAWERAAKFLANLANRGGNILFVGTKQQAKSIVREAAERCGCFSVTHRWLGGTLSNFETIKRSISRMKKLEDLLQKAGEEDSKVKLAKKERLSISKELEKLEANLGGIRNMKHLPDVLFIVDIGRESIAVKEARKLHIPVVALVDTNVDPREIDYPIPSNDDSSQTIRLFVNAAADLVLEGREAFLARGAERRAAAEKAAEKNVQRKKQRGKDAKEQEAPSEEGATTNGASAEATTTEATAS